MSVEFNRYIETATQLLTDPDDPVALVNRHALLAGRFERSAVHLALARRAAALSGSIYAKFNLASAMSRAGHYLDACEAFRGCLEIAPPDKRAEVLHHIGMAHHDLGEFDAAVKWYDQALAVDNDPEIHRSRAIARLAGGHLGDGLAAFEIEHHKPARKPIGQAGIPRWRGEDLSNKTIVYAHEQGYGDTIQFIRFLPRLKAGRVIVSMPPELSALLKEHFEADEWVDESGPFTADYYCSPMSLCGALGIEYGEVVGKPYLRSSALSLPRRGYRRIGLVWRGSPGYSQDATRSIALDALAPLFELPGLAFYSLQMGDARKELTKLGLDGFIGDLTCTIRDWRDTARAIMAMDEIVSVDTAVAHLAGALGKPVRLMIPYSPCWRWMRGRSDTPWYENTTLYRQAVPNNWGGPVFQISEALRG